MKLRITSWNINQLAGLESWVPGPVCRGITGVDDGSMNPKAAYALRVLGESSFPKKYRWKDPDDWRKGIESFRCGPFDYTELNPTYPNKSIGNAQLVSNWLKRLPYGFACIQEPSSAEFLRLFCKSWTRQVVTWPGYTEPHWGPRTPGAAPNWCFGYAPAIITSSTLLQPRRLIGDFPGHDGRGMLAGNIQERGTLKAVLCTLHTNYRAAAATLASYRPIWEAMLATYPGVIVTGDFNLSISSRIPLPDGTTERLDTWMAGLGFRQAIHYGIDGIWVGGAVRVTGARAESDTWRKSDHTAISCDVEL